MRARGGTVYAKQSPMKRPSPDSGNSNVNAELIVKPKPNYEELAKMFEDFGPMNATSFKDSFTGDFKRLDDQDSCSTASTACSYRDPAEMSLSRASSTFSNIDCTDEPCKSQKVIRGMVIGCENNSERHSFVNAMFPSIEGEVDASQKFDLATRKIEREALVERYHFWLKEAETRESHHQTYYNTYYKSSSVFFLVCNVKERKSLDALERELQQIENLNNNNNNNNNKEVLNILILSGAQEATEASLGEVEQLRVKHNIKHLLEIEAVAQKREELRGLLEGLSK